MRTTMRRPACVLLMAALTACGAAPVAPGYYRVERGDTLSHIARSHRQSVANITRWNSISNPDAIEVGQVLRVEPPGNTASAPGSAGSRSRPQTQAGGTADASRSPAAGADVPAPAAGTIALIWPAPGKVARGFDGVNSKGIDIVNAAGTPVLAAAPGTVVYAGNGLRGYGNLVILKHNADFLTAYAHNRTLLVKEGQRVDQGQTIAEMGDTDNDHVALHFEVRYGGKSVDPSRYLPAR